VRLTSAAVSGEDDSTELWARDLVASGPDVTEASQPFDADPDLLHGAELFRARGCASHHSYS
jgi:hypothetical protein